MAKKTTTANEKYSYIINELADLKTQLAERRHYDTLIVDTANMVKGNGKPGFAAIRDKVLSFEGKINMIGIAIVVDIVTRLLS